jgi:Alginate export
MRSVRRLLTALCTAALLAAAPATAADPPKAQILRFNEDWSSVAVEDLEGIDEAKHIPLNDSGSFWVSMAAQARARAELWRNFLFGAPDPADDAYLLTRVRVSGDFHFGEHFRFFVDAYSALSTDRELPGGRRGVDVNSLDSSNLFVDFRIQAPKTKLTFRLGRQQFLFGKQRLVSPLPWTNSYRTWQGLDVIIQPKGWNIHAFGSYFVPVKKYSFDTADSDLRFAGAYGQWTRRQLEFYYLRNENRNVDDRRDTFGSRWWKRVLDGRVDWDIEGAVQGGSVGDLDVRASMFGGEGGYTFLDAKMTPRVFLGLDYGSGDGDPTDDRAGTFDQMFPLGHAFLGHIDHVGRRNIIDFSQGVNFVPAAKMKLIIQNHIFWRDRIADGLYDAGGALIRPAAGSDARYIGNEIDITWIYKPTRRLNVLVGLDRFFTGAFLEETGPSKDITFGYAQALWLF